MEEADPLQPRLKSIALDDRIKMSGKQTQSPWVCRLEGDSTEYVNEAGKVVSHGVAVVRSLVWPGSFTLFQNGK